MKTSQRFWRGFFFLFMIVALCGGLALPVAEGIPARAAPQMQSTACLGTTITQWTFLGDVITTSTGTGTFVPGSGLPSPAFFTGNPDRAVSFDTWTSALDNTKYIDLHVPTSGRNSIGITFDYRSTNTGPLTLELDYSTDGSSFTIFGSPISLNNDATFHSLSFDVSTIVGLDDNANAVFRLYAYGATNASGALRLDNITLTGTCLDSLTSTEAANRTATVEADNATGTASAVNATATASAANATGTASAVNATNTAAALTATSTRTRTPTRTSTPTRTGTPTRTPTPQNFLKVLINEVAWAGTAKSTSDEWIELYNPGSSPVNLTGWILQTADGELSIPLGGTLAPNGFYILERDNDDTIIDVTANQIFTVALANTNETLQLLDNESRIVDTANSNGGSWPAGLTGTFNSMERRGVVRDSNTAWITNVKSSTWTKHDGRCTLSNLTTACLIRGTPGYANWAITVTPTPSRTPTRTPTKFKTRTPTPAPPPPLVGINEFVPRPGHDWNLDGVINTGDEYIELINHGVIDVNLNGYSLDDEVNIGSEPFRLPAVTIKPGERIVFYGSQTGLLLGDGGDGVRLLKPNGQLGDAYNYSVVRFPDESYCRLPDNGGLDDWNEFCFPTPGLQNSLSESSVNPPISGDEESLCPVSDTLPEAFVFAECEPFGSNIWNRDYWDRNGWFDEKELPEGPGKSPPFAD